MKTFNKTLINSASSVTIGVLAIVSGLASSAIAHAADADPRWEEIVNYADLDLETDKGAKVLFARLRQAAQVVCKPLEGRNLSMRAHWQTCYDRALASAVTQVNKGSVSALYEASVTPKTKS